MIFATEARSAEDLHYDPSACKADAHGRMYIALGRNVLAVAQPSSGTVLGYIYPKLNIEKLAPPDPQQPEGCPDNPLQLESYAFNYLYEEGMAKKWGVEPATRPAPDLLQIINNQRQSEATSNTWIGEDSEIQIAQTICERATVQEHLSNGLHACRVKPVQDWPIADWGASYTTTPDIYASPTGRLFAVNCGPGLSRGGSGSCTVSYRLQPGLDITYRFQPFRGPRAIPIEHIIEFDRDVRRQIEAELVKDYVWPK